MPEFSQYTLVVYDCFCEMAIMNVRVLKPTVLLHFLSQFLASQE